MTDIHGDSLNIPNIFPAEPENDRVFFIGTIPQTMFPEYKLVLAVTITNGGDNGSLLGGYSICIIQNQPISLHEDVYQYQILNIEIASISDQFVQELNIPTLLNQITEHLTVNGQSIFNILQGGNQILEIIGAQNIDNSIHDSVFAADLAINPGIVDPVSSYFFQEINNATQTITTAVASAEQLVEEAIAQFQFVIPDILPSVPHLPGIDDAANHIYESHIQGVQHDNSGSFTF